MYNYLDTHTYTHTHTHTHTLTHTHSHTHTHIYIDIYIFVQLGFSSFRVTTDKKSSTILIYQNEDTNVCTENDGID
jgi:hypothetical protein